MLWLLMSAALWHAACQSAAKRLCVVIATILYCERLLWTEWGLNPR